MLFDDMKRTVEALPLETNAVTSVAARLPSLDAPAFAVLLRELARDNHAFRHVRGSPAGLRPCSNSQNGAGQRPIGAACVLGGDQESCVPFRKPMRKP